MVAYVLRCDAHLRVVVAVVVLVLGLVELLLVGDVVFQ